MRLYYIYDYEYEQEESYNDFSQKGCKDKIV